MKWIIFTVAFQFQALCAFAVDTSFSSKGRQCSFDKFMLAFVQAEKDAPAANTFLVATGTKHPEGEYWVYWPQKREILLVAWPAEDCRSPRLQIHRRLELTKDIVKSVADVGASTYLVTEEWASNVIYEAAKNGYQTTVTK